MNKYEYIQVDLKKIIGIEDKKMIVKTGEK